MTFEPRQQKVDDESTLNRRNCRNVLPRTYDLVHLSSSQEHDLTQLAK